MRLILIFILSLFTFNGLAQSLTKKEKLNLLSKNNFTSDFIGKTIDLKIYLKQIDQSIILKKAGLKEDLIFSLLSKKKYLTEIEINEILDYQKKGYSNELILKIFDNYADFNSIPLKVTSDKYLIEFLSKLQQILEEDEKRIENFIQQCEESSISERNEEDDDEKRVEWSIESNDLNESIDFKLNDISEIWYDNLTLIHESKPTEGEMKAKYYKVTGTIFLKNDKKTKLDINLIQLGNYSYYVQSRYKR